MFSDNTEAPPLLQSAIQNPENDIPPKTSEQTLIVDDHFTLKTPEPSAPKKESQPIFHAKHSTKEEQYKAAEKRKIKHHKAKEITPDWEAQTTEKKQKKNSNSLFPLLLIFTLLLLACSFVFLLIKRKNSEKIIVDTTPTLPTAPQTAVQAAREAKPIIRHFLDAQNAKERLQYCRLPKLTKDLMHTYYELQKYPQGQIPYLKIQTGPTVTKLGQLYTLNIELGDYSTRAIAFEWTPEGYKIDWASFVQFNEMNFDTFRTQRPTSPKLFRALISYQGANYWNYRFNDKTEYDCLAIIDQNTGAKIYGYIRKNTQIAERLRSDLLKNTQITATLRLAFPKNPIKDNQVEITHYITSGWVLQTDQQIQDAWGKHYLR